MNHPTAKKTKRSKSKRPAKVRAKRNARIYAEASSLLTFDMGMGETSWARFDFTPEGVTIDSAWLSRRATTLGKGHARHLAAKLIAWANTKPTPKARPRNGK